MTNGRPRSLRTDKVCDAAFSLVKARPNGPTLVEESCAENWAVVLWNRAASNKMVARGLEAIFCDNLERVTVAGDRATNRIAKAKKVQRVNDEKRREVLAGRHASIEGSSATIESRRLRPVGDRYRSPSSAVRPAACARAQHTPINHARRGRLRREPRRVRRRGRRWRATLRWA